MPSQLCDVFIFPKPGFPKPIVQCKNPAKYRYQVTKGRVEYLCGVHARRLKDNPYLCDSLTPLAQEKP
jgi:hypothetical protein